MPSYKVHPDGRRLGKKPAKRDTRNLQFASYVLPTLPAPPSSIDHSSKVSDWGMMGNSDYGDCVMAALGHDVLQWTTYATKPFRPTDTQIIAAYLALSPNDDGLDMLSTLKWMKNTGLAGHKIGAFVELDAKNRDEIKLAVQIFGNAFIGVALSNTNTFGPWIDVIGPPNPNNGHCITYTSYDGVGPLPVTWGDEEPASWSWHDAYCEEAYAILSLDWFTTDGLTIEEFNLAQLQYDLAHLGDPVDGPQPPEPPSPGGCNKLMGALYRLTHP